MSIAVPLRIADPERRAGRWAALSGAVSVGTLIAALIAANTATTTRAGSPTRFGASDADRLRELTTFHRAPSTQALAAGLRGLALVLGIGVGVYLYWMVRRRGATVGRLVLVTAIAGPILVAGATAFGFLALRDVADAFYASGPRTAARASALVDHSTRLRVAGVLDVGSRIVFAVWVGALSYHARRVELLTTFLGYWGVGAAAAMVLLPVGDAMYVGWLASMAVLSWGYWPGGMPAGWGRRS
ncbi:MAG: hypothetical protein JWN32_342 [Solirubrobacterales bacterium]|nr:hypothetical protein [Solirubrobacterales bacterium]